MAETKKESLIDPGIESLRWLTSKRLQAIGEDWDVDAMGARPQAPPFTDPEQIIATAKEYVSSQRVGYLDYGTGYEFALGGSAAAQLSVERIDDKTARIEYFNVLQPLQGSGFGGRLMRSAVQRLKADGIATIVSDNISRQALAVRAAVFGEQALQFYTTDEFEGQKVTPTNFGDAVSVINGIYRAHPASSQASPDTFGVRVDLAECDTANWEQPLPLRKLDYFDVEFQGQ